MSANPVEPGETPEVGQPADPEAQSQAPEETAVESSAAGQETLPPVTNGTQSGTNQQEEPKQASVSAGGDDGGTASRMVEAKGAQAKQAANSFVTKVKNAFQPHFNFSWWLVGPPERDSDVRIHNRNAPRPASLPKPASSEDPIDCCMCVPKSLRVISVSECENGDDEVPETDSFRRHDLPASQLIEKPFSKEQKRSILSENRGWRVGPYVIGMIIILAAFDVWMQYSVVEVEGSLDLTASKELLVKTDGCHVQLYNFDKDNFPFRKGSTSFESSKAYYVAFGPAHWLEQLDPQMFSLSTKQGEVSISLSSSQAAFLDLCIIRLAVPTDVKLSIETSRKGNQLISSGVGPDYLTMIWSGSFTFFVPSVQVDSLAISQFGAEDDGLSNSVQNSLDVHLVGLTANTFASTSHHSRMYCYNCTATSSSIAYRRGWLDWHTPDAARVVQSGDMGDASACLSAASVNAVGGTSDSLDLQPNTSVSATPSQTLTISTPTTTFLDSVKYDTTREPEGQIFRSFAVNVWAPFDNVNGYKFKAQRRRQSVTGETFSYKLNDNIDWLAVFNETTKSFVTNLAKMDNTYSLKPRMSTVGIPRAYQTFKVYSLSFFASLPDSLLAGLSANVLNQIPIDFESEIHPGFCPSFALQDVTCTSTAGAGGAGTLASGEVLDCTEDAVKAPAYSELSDSATLGNGRWPKKYITGWNVPTNETIDNFKCPAEEPEQFPGVKVYPGFGCHGRTAFTSDKFKHLMRTFISQLFVWTEVPETAIGVWIFMGQLNRFFFIWDSESQDWFTDTINQMFFSIRYDSRVNIMLVVSILLCFVVSITAIYIVITGTAMVRRNFSVSAFLRDTQLQDSVRIVVLGSKLLESSRLLPRVNVSTNPFYVLKGVRDQLHNEAKGEKQPSSYKQVSFNFFDLSVAEDGGPPQKKVITDKNWIRRLMSFTNVLSHNFRVLPWCPIWAPFWFLACTIVFELLFVLFIPWILGISYSNWLFAFVPLVVALVIFIAMNINRMVWVKGQAKFVSTSFPSRRNTVNARNNKVQPEGDNTPPSTALSVSPHSKVTRLFNEVIRPKLFVASSSNVPDHTDSSRSRVIVNGSVKLGKAGLEGPVWEMTKWLCASSNPDSVGTQNAMTWTAWTDQAESHDNTLLISNVKTNLRTDADTGVISIDIELECTVANIAQLESQDAQQKKHTETANFWSRQVARNVILQLSVADKKAELAADNYVSLCLATVKSIKYTNRLFSPNFVFEMLMPSIAKNPPNSIEEGAYNVMHHTVGNELLSPIFLGFCIVAFVIPTCIAMLIISNVVKADAGDLPIPAISIPFADALWILVSQAFTPNFFITIFSIIFFWVAVYVAWMGIAVIISTCSPTHFEMALDHRLTKFKVIFFGRIRLFTIRYGDRFDHGFSLKFGPQVADDEQDAEESVPLLPSGEPSEGSQMEEDEGDDEEEEELDPKSIRKVAHYKTAIVNSSESGRSTNTAYRLMMTMNSISWGFFIASTCASISIIILWTLFIILGAFVKPGALIAWVTSILGLYSNIASVYNHYMKLFKRIKQRVKEQMEEIIGKVDTVVDGVMAEVLEAQKKVDEIVRKIDNAEKQAREYRDKFWAARDEYRRLKSKKDGVTFDSEESRKAKWAARQKLKKEWDKQKEIVADQVRDRALAIADVDSIKEACRKKTGISWSDIEQKAKWIKILSSPEEFTRVLENFGLTKRQVILALINGTVILLLCFAFLLTGLSAFQSTQGEGDVLGTLFSGGGSIFATGAVNSAQTSELPKEELRRIVGIIVKKFRTALAASEDSDLISSTGVTVDAPEIKKKESSNE